MSEIAAVKRGNSYGHPAADWPLTPGGIALQMTGSGCIFVNRQITLQETATLPQQSRPARGPGEGS